jgi:hypothetical protein
VYGATEYETVPLPLPLAPDVIVIHETSQTAVQPHPPPVVTTTFPDPPALANDTREGEIEEEQLPAPVLPILLTVPPRSTTYSSPCSSSPNDEIFMAVSSRTLWLVPSQPWYFVASSRRAVIWWVSR